MNTNAAGVDVSSRKSTVAVLRPFSEVVKLPFDVRHSAEDLTALAAQLKSIDGETRVVMEHIGRYYESVAKVLRCCFANKLRKIFIQSAKKKRRLKGF